MMANVILNVIFVTIFLSGSLLSSSKTVTSLRIYGGRPAFREEIPYIVSIGNGRHHFCAGSILNKQWVVTVAHCVSNETGLRVHAGMLYSTKKNTRDVQIVQVQEVFVHPNYSLDMMDNDVALLLLARNLSFNDVVQPVKIINEDELSEAVDNRRTGIISGWGHSENSFRSKILRTAEVELLSDEECLDDIPPYCFTFNPEAHLCSGPLIGEQIGVGLHDDGGPLVVNDKLAGIILHRDPEDCHLSSVYARISHFRNFFVEHNILVGQSTQRPIQSEPYWLEIEISWELLNESDTSNFPSHQSGSFLFDYKLWFFGSRDTETHDLNPTTANYDLGNSSDVSDSEYPDGYATEAKLPGGTSSVYEENQDESETTKSRTLDEDNEPSSANPKKLILNIQVWNSSRNAQEGIGFRLFPNSPVDYFVVLISTRTE